MFFFVASIDTGYTQTIYYSNDSCRMVAVSESGITTSSDVVTFSWCADSLFAAPYTIIYIADGEDTLSNYQLELPSFVVKTSLASHSEVDIVDNEGRRKVIQIAYDKPFRIPLWVISYVLLIVAVVFLYLYNRKKEMQDVPDEAMRVPIRAAHGSKKYECATVLFADIQGFTKIAERLNQDQLIDELDRYFIYFDELVDQFSVEKIKTIGDAYMCAGGVPEPDSANPIEVTLVGLGMIAYVKQRQVSENGFWNIRVGINTGAVVSGLLGNKKRVFDIWGDSVNLASRMESSGMPGEVNVSGDTYLRICDYFECEHRGRMPVKYKGEVDMYFIKRLKPEYAEPGSTYKPNDVLKRKMQRLKIADLEAYIHSLLFPSTDKLEEEFFEMFSVRLDTLALAEKLTDEQYIICKVSGLLSYISTRFVREYKSILLSVNSSLRRMRLSEDLIQSIAKIAEHTAAMRQPSSIIEQIVEDARNERFGRKDFIRIEINMGKATLQKNKRSFMRKNWFREELAALNAVQYYTESAKNLVEVDKEEQIRAMNQIIHLL
ncbi:MAG: adenylate/guanylate cyclase domain-containing protein [Bacteroidales bacterium]|nr:adenylate/guanylate cyclase domain-containing protein [Bacteroidales bacterium]